MDDSNFIEMNLCGACRHLLEEDGRKVKRVAVGKDTKVKCAVCFRTRFGGTYAVSKEVRSAP